MAQKIDVISSEVNNSQNIIDKNIKEIKEQININTINDNEKIDLRIKQNLFNSMIQKYKTNIENSLNAIKGMDADLQQPIEQIKQQLDLTLQKYQGRLKTAQQRTFSTQNYQQ